MLRKKGKLRLVDIVTVISSNDSQSNPTILESFILGSARPCESLLETGDAFRPAERCLLKNGFKRVLSQSLGDKTLTVYVRKRC